MAKYYYILTTEKFIHNYERKEDALHDFGFWKKNSCKHLRLERANAETGTAKVIKEHNNIW